MIYFDNSATTYPKPSYVIKQAYYGLKDYSFNSGRGGYVESLRAASAIYDVREKVGAMFGVLPSNVVFTKNCTEALNIAIKGIVKRGDHIIISSLEHNAVSRVVQKLYEQGIAEFSIARYSYDDNECVSNFERLIKPNTSLIVCMHSSNVFGVSFPIAQIGKLCRQKGIKFIVDAAQGAGLCDIKADRDNIDVICSAGHKCLFGSMGTGFMAIADGVKLDTLTEGGTGSNSLDLHQPDFLPDRFEAGTLNNSGIISLGSGIDFINRVGMQNIYSHEMNLALYLYNMLDSVEKVKLYTPPPKMYKSVPIVSFNVNGYSSESVAEILADNRICVRAGYHCSPFAHKHFETLDSGTVRVSLGFFNKPYECNRLINVVKKL